MLQHHSVLRSLIDLDVIVARIDHPKPWQPKLFKNQLLDHRVRWVIFGIHDFGREPQLAIGHGDQGEVRTDFRVLGYFYAGTRRQQSCAGEVGDAGEDTTVKAFANLLVARARTATVESLALQ